MAAAAGRAKRRVIGGPLVSITVPCYNEASLLGWALASVLAQTYQDWECLVIDDGSEDHPLEVVDVFCDERIRFIRLDANRGRAAARQVALDAAHGDYLAKLDADDWLYPRKLARQVEVMEALQHAALVSTGIAIEDEGGRLSGVRARGTHGEMNVNDAMRRLASPPLAHAASMMRMAVAKRQRYDTHLRRSEDAGYLLKVLLENRYCVLHDVLYAYREYLSASRREILDAYRYRMRMFWAFRKQFPVASLRRSAETALKWGAHQVAFVTGQSDWLVGRRTQRPTADDVCDFEQARAQVAAVYGKYFGQGTSLLVQHEEVGA